MDLQARYVKHLRAQAKTAEPASADGFHCPYCEGRVFQIDDQLWDHVRLDHSSILGESGVNPREPSLFRKLLREEALRKGKAEAGRSTREASLVSAEATVGAGSTPDIAPLSIDTRKKDPSPPYPTGRKRAAASDIQTGEALSRGSPRKSPPVRPRIVDPDDAYAEKDLDYSRDIPYSVSSESPQIARTSHARLYDPRQNMKPAPSPHSQANRIQSYAQPRPPISGPQNQSARDSPRHDIKGQQLSAQRKPGIIELQRSDPRYPGLLLQPDSRPISQEQLASEVKSIYAGLTMVETKCIHVDRAQSTAGHDAESGPKSNLENDHWQALIALHRTLLHEHHDFFLASQHPSASPALRRLASKYSMPARMWKHGIHSFLELLRRRLPESLDYMLAFIYLAYQMMALLYETVPTFEDTWIECLGDLGRYRMAIEDEDLRDRETWAGVARSWYSKAADKSPSVGRLYHHLAILARPNALQQLYYYARSLTCVLPFMSARESILTLLDPIVGRAAPSYSQALPIDTSFIKTHAILFGRLSLDHFDEAAATFLGQLDNHIGRVTAKWKEQGIYVAITNTAGLFKYGSEDSPLRSIFQGHAEKLRSSSSRQRSNSPDDDVSPPTSPAPSASLPMTEEAVSSQVDTLLTDDTFSCCCSLTFSTLALVLRRIGDKNVLPHAHCLLALLWSLASVPYVTRLMDSAPWDEIASFLNTLAKSEKLESLISAPLFPLQNQNDVRPLPEDYHIRGQVWSQWYFPEAWFAGEHDEEERSLELASTIKSRTERILRLGFQISSYERWIKYDSKTLTWSVVQRSPQVKPDPATGSNVSQLSNTLSSHTLSGPDAMEVDSTSGTAVD